MSEEPIVVRQISAFIPVSTEQLDDARGTGDAVQAFLAMTPEQRAAFGAKRDAEWMAAQAVAEAEARRFLGWLRAAVVEGPLAGVCGHG